MSAARQRMTKSLTTTAHQSFDDSPDRIDVVFTRARADDADDVDDRGAIEIDPGGPSRPDIQAPRIVEMRVGKMTWAEIGWITALGTRNAHDVWKRRTTAQGQPTVANP